MAKKKPSNAAGLYYQSLGRSVEKQANVQRRARRPAGRGPVAGPPTPKRAGVGPVAGPPTPARQTPTRRPGGRVVAGPPTPRPSELRQIRQRNERVRRREDRRASERAARIVARRLRQDARRYRTVAGPPTPSYAQLHGLPKREQKPGIFTALLGGESVKAAATGKGAASESKVAKRYVKAPALEAMEQLQRTSYAAGGVTRGIKEGESVGKIVGRAVKGARLKGKTETPGEVVLEDWQPKSGIGKVAKGAATVAIDIPTDITSYAGVGLIGVGAKTALKASETAGRAATRAQLKVLRAEGKLSSREARKEAKAHGDEVRRRVYDREARKHDVENERRGVSVTFAGRRTRQARQAVGRRVVPKPVRRAVRKKGPAAPLTRATVALGRSQARGVEQALGGRIPLTKTTGRDVGKALRRIASSVHGEVRPVRTGRKGEVAISHEQNVAEKALRREGRAETERLIRDSQGRYNALWKRLSDDDAVRVRDAIESGRLGSLRDRAARKRAQLIRDPDERLKAVMKIDAEEKRLIDAAKELRDEGRYLQRVESRAGPLAGRVGKTSRSAEEIELGARTHVSPKRQEQARAIHERETTRQIEELEKDFGRKTIRRRAQLDQLRKESDQLDRYYKQIRLTGTAAERKAVADAKVNVESQIRDLKANAKQDRLTIDRTRETREAELKDLRLEQAATRAQAEGAAKSAKVVKRERLREQAKDYFPRATDEELDELVQGGLIQRLAADLKPSREKVGRAKPKAGAQKQRTHRETVAALREGTPEQRAHAERLSENVREVQALRGLTGARSTGQAILNRKIADRFGEKLPNYANVTRTALKDLRDQGKSVYYVERGNLERLDPVDDYGEIKRASMTPEQRARGDMAARLLAKEEKREIKVPERGGRYVVLDDSTVARVQGDEMGLGSKPGLEAWDAANRGFKTLALMTPQYLTRNFTGDMFNAWTDENVFRLMRNVTVGQRPLHALGQRERALRLRNVEKRRKKLNQIEHSFTRFNKLIGRDPKMRQIKLTPEVARELAGPSAQRLYQVIKRGDPSLSKKQIQDQIEENLRTGKVSPVAFAQMAERYGVVRQGRFMELMQEGRSPLKGRPGGPWTSTVKRVEDSHRIATFMGGLQRGMTPREAADRAIQLHFDYGDLTPIEKGVFRRLAPFYTFPSRNIPLQAKQLVRRPGKYSTIEKIRQQAASAAGLEEGWEDKLSDFEARQIPLPMKFGDQTITASIGSPFTDLNDVIGFGKGAANIARSVTNADAFKAAQALQVPLIPVRRAMEMLGPIKVFAELPLNKSFYFREDIAPEGRTLTRAPNWAVTLSKIPGYGDAVRSVTGMKQKGDGPVMWDKRSEHTLRAFAPGIIGMGKELSDLIPGVNLGVQGENARGRTPGQRAIGYAGPRVVTYDVKQARVNANYDRRARLDATNSEARQLARETAEAKGRVATEEDWQTPAYKRRLKVIRRIDDRIDALEGRAKPKATDPWSAKGGDVWDDAGGDVWDDANDGSVWKKQK